MCTYIRPTNNSDPRFPILTERFITTNDSLSNKRKETELKIKKNTSSELKFEVKVKFQDLIPHPVFHVANIEHKFSHAPYEVRYMDFNRDPHIADLAYGKIVFYNPYPGLKLTTSFETTLLSFTHIILCIQLLHNTHAIPIELTDYLPSDDPNNENLIASHYNCTKQHKQFNLIIVKQCTDAPSNIQHVNGKARVYVCAKAKPDEAFKCELVAKKEQKICFQASVDFRRVDRTVWNHNTMPLHVTLDPVECKHLIRHINGTNNENFNNLNYNRTLTLLEDQYFQEKNFKPLLLSIILTKCTLVRLY